MISRTALTGAIACLALTTLPGACATSEGPAVDGSWRATEINGAATTSPMTLEFHSDGTFSGAAPCATFDGQYEQRGRTLIFGAEMTVVLSSSPSRDRWRCRFISELDGEQRRAFSELSGEFTAAAHGDELVLTNDRGQSLRLER